MSTPIKVENVSYESLSCPIGSEVCLPDGRQAKVLGYRNEQTERVVLFADGSRRSVGIEGLQLVRMPPPRPEPAVEHAPRPAPEPPGMVPAWNRPAPVPDEGKTRAREGPPLIVQGDYTPEMFVDSRRGPECIALSGGPYDGVLARVPHAAVEHALPAANPDRGPGQNGYIPATYRRTKERNEAGDIVFAFVQPAAEKPS